MTSTNHAPALDVAIIGAGPYGLSTAAHLRARGIGFHIFGEPMSYWSEMPRGMLLRSPWHASHIDDPTGEHSLGAYEAQLGRPLERPIPLDDFIAYGRWVQQRVAPALDPRKVLQVRSAEDGFALELEDGSVVRAHRVVVATGLLEAERRLGLLASLPADRVSHTADLRDPAAFAGRRVLVVGGGQSATESAALLAEAGADVEVAMRAPAVNWLVRSGRLHQSRLRPLLYPDTDVGPPILNQIVCRPRLLRRFPYRVQAAMAQRSIRPAAAGWLRPRLASVPIACGRAPVAARQEGDEVVVRLDDGSERRVDHVLQGTGFQLDVGRHPLLAPELVVRIAARDGYPALDGGYQSSVPGLYFAGALSAVSQGPVMRFVSGTRIAGPAIAASIAAVRPALAQAAAVEPLPTSGAAPHARRTA